VLSTRGYRLTLDPPGGPLTIAAFGERAVRTAAAHADRMVLDLVSPELAGEYRAKLDGAARAAGRPAPALAAWIPAAIDPDPDSYAELMNSLTGYLEVPGYGEMFTAAGFGEAVQAAGAGATHAELLDGLPPDAASRMGLVGDVDTVRAPVEVFAEEQFRDLDDCRVRAEPTTRSHAPGKRVVPSLAGDNLLPTVFPPHVTDGRAVSS
jgi:alkanesulfonate monooxygenase SsuD/methylene tetrahydromethanopterin reductase-like flavin-dependent oxidoreductase (luciferase family)